MRAETRVGLDGTVLDLGPDGTTLPGTPVLSLHTTGDPIVPPLRVVVEAPNGVEGVADALRTELGARFEVQAVAPGALPVGEQKTRVVYRTARGEELPL